MFTKNTFLAFLLVMPFFIYAQNVSIKGVVLDSLNNPIQNAIIQANPNHDLDEILGYASSNDKGEFLFTVNNFKAENISLQVNHIAYNSLTISFSSFSNSNKIILQNKSHELENLVINFEKILKVKGDTLTYNVAGLKAEKDYSIEEVINRIPGISINDNGQIKYKDKPISHLYINGIDLLEGRYNIATRGIPADAVKEIDVLTKHNHERIDIGRTDSEKVSLNLTIKENQNLVFGSVKAEAGLPLVTGNLDATPIYIKNSFQNISSLKTNNIGISLKNIGSDLSLDASEFFRLQTPEINFISPTNVNGVNLSNKNWLNNDSYAFTTDALHKVTDSTLVKWNINYANELSKISKTNNTIYFFETDSTYVNNKSQNKLRGQNFQASSYQEINKRNFYLKNKTSFLYSDNEGIENNTLNIKNIQAYFNKYNTKFSNTTLLKTLVRKKNILQSGFLFQTNFQNEKLNVFPTVFESVLGNSPNNQKTQQRINLQQLNFSAFTDYTFNLLGLKWDILQNAQYQKFNLETNLSQQPQNSVSIFPYSSDFNYQKFQTNTSLTTKWQYQNLTIKANLLANLNNLKTHEPVLVNSSNKNTYVFFNPSFNLKYEFNSKWSGSVNYSKSQNVSDFNQIYPGVILQSFNNLAQNPEIINQHKINAINTQISYSNIYKSFFARLLFQNSDNQSQITINNEVDNNGFLINRIINRPNTVKNFGYTIDLSKGILGVLNTNFKYNFNQGENQLYFNQQFMQSITKSHRIETSINWDTSKWFGLNYNLKFNYFTSNFSNTKVNNNFLNHKLTADFYTSSTTRIQLFAENAQIKSLHTKGSNYMFNADFYYKPSKKIIYKAAFTNILNTNHFLTSMGGINSISVSQFELRPRQFTVGITYSL